MNTSSSLHCRPRTSHAGTSHRGSPRPGGASSPLLRAAFPRRHDGVSPTLFSACTGMWEASMSFRSRSASYLRSLETLNLQSKAWVWLSPEETRTVINGRGAHSD